LVSIQSAYGGISINGNSAPSAWIPKGQTATITAQSQVGTTFGHAAFFKGFSGDVISSEREVKLIVDRPKGVKVSWVLWKLDSISEVWTKNGEEARVKIKVSWLDDGSAANAISVKCLEGEGTNSGDDGIAEFGFISSPDSTTTKNFIAVSNGEQASENTVSVRLVFTNIVLSVSVENGHRVGDEYWFDSGSEARLSFSAKWTHDGTSASGLKLTNVETGENLSEHLSIRENHKKVSMKFSTEDKGIKSNLVSVELIFTSIRLSARRQGSLVNLKASWSHDGSSIAELQVMCFETRQTEATGPDGCTSFEIVGLGFEVTFVPISSVNGITVYQEAKVGL